MAASLIVGTASCGGSGGRTQPQAGAETTTQAPAVTTTIDPNKEIDIAVDYDNMASIDTVDSKNEEGTGKNYVPGQKAGLVKGLCYYDLTGLTPDVAEIFAERFGGTVETTMTNSIEYFDKMATLIAAGDSPDLVRYDWQAFPDGVVRGRYEALDDWLDIDSPLWSGEKSVIEQFAYKGKHCYFPQNIQPNFAIHYNKVLLDEMAMDDPMDLYFAGEWTWDKFEEMMKQWVTKGDDYIGFTGGSWSSMQFANTTGVKTFDMTDNDIINNLRSPEVTRTMSWLESLCREGLTGEGYIHPEEAFKDGKLLFLAMGLTWGFESAQEGMFKIQADAEICSVPFPRDPKADKYYLSTDSLGYMVPKGAQNVQGAVQWILSARIHDTDPDIIAEKRAEMMYDGPNYYPKCPSCKYNFVENDKDDLDNCPECGAARKTKFKPVYSERQLQVIDDMTNPEKFGLIFDNAYGFSNEFNNVFVGSDDTVFDGPLYHGVSYTNKLEELNSVIEAFIDPYRDFIREQ